MHEVDLPEVLSSAGPSSTTFLRSLDKSDPELGAWFDRASTVLMVMSTHFDCDAPLARCVLEGLLSDVDACTQLTCGQTELHGVFDELLVSAHDHDRVCAVT